ncbi:MAG: toxin-antitoxin system antitoxin subunit [Pseudomonas sp.]|nr:toxin-antitoxin system antitoxin subunit [Pseudomonas sp.]
MNVTTKDAPANEAVKASKRIRITKQREPELSVKELDIARYSVVVSGSHRAPEMVAFLLPGKAGDDRMAVYRAVSSGFPLQSVINMIEHSEVYKRSGVLSRIVGTSDRTLARRMKTPDEALTPEQSTRALYYAEVLEKATEVLGSRELAEQWMIKPARGLDGELPIDLISNSVGYELVTDFLTRMDYGVY